MSKLCKECGYGEHYHHKPLSEMRKCDLDFRCFPQEMWPEIRKTIEHFQYRTALEKIREMTKIMPLAFSENSVWNKSKKIHDICNKTLEGE